MHIALIIRFDWDELNYQATSNIRGMLGSLRSWAGLVIHRARPASPHPLCRLRLGYLGLDSLQPECKSLLEEPKLVFLVSL
jgi:hypothetical protein